MNTKTIFISSVGWWAALNASALSIVPPQSVYDPAEVLWFSANDSNVVAVLGDGSVGIWDFSSGGLRYHFSLPGSPPGYPNDNLSLSRSQPLALLTLVDQGEFRGKKLISSLTVYDVAGKRMEKSPALEMDHPASCGFIGKTSTLIVTDNLAVVTAVDAQTGRTLWRTETDDDVQTGTIVLADGKYHVNFCRDDHLHGRNQSGKLVWDWPVPKDKFAEPGYWPDNPSLPYVVVYESNTTNETIADFTALSAQTGKEVWRKAGGRLDSLKAVSNDGRRQVFSGQGRVEITALPQSAKPQVIALHDPEEAVFSPNGHFIFCLPSFEAVSEHSTDNKRSIARASKLLSVVAAETGEIVRQFTLVLPSEKN